MHLSNKNFILHPHPSGKITCKVAVLENDDKYFVKYLRTYDNEFHTAEEIFNEVLEERILAALDISDLNHSVEPVNSRIAIVQRYYAKNWSNVASEGLEIANFDEWPLFLTAETWVRQTDRGPGKNEHVGLAVVDGVGSKYRAGPLDLGCSFVGQPGGYEGVDDDLTSDWVKSLFWTKQDFPKAALEEAIAKIEKLSIVQIVNSAMEHILQASNWSEEVKVHIKKHGDRVANFLYARRAKLKEVLLGWWDQAHAGVVETPAAQVAAV